MCVWSNSQEAPSGNVLFAHLQVQHRISIQRWTEALTFRYYGGFCLSQTLAYDDVFRIKLTWERWYFIRSSHFILQALADWLEEARCSRRQNVKRQTQVHFLWRLFSTPRLLTPPSPKRTHVDILFGPTLRRIAVDTYIQWSLHYINGWMAYGSSVSWRGKER